MASESKWPGAQLILGLLPLALGLELIIWIVYLPQAIAGNADFRVYYSGARLVASGRGDQIYDDTAEKATQDESVSVLPTFLPFIHPPYEALFFAPLALLSYRVGYLVFLGFNLLCLFCSYWLLRARLCEWRQTWRWLPVLAMLGFAPVQAALMQGQDSLILLLLLAAALELVTKNDLFTGLALGLGMFRFQIVIPIILLLLIWRRWRIVLGWLASCGVMAALSLFVAGATGIQAYAYKLYLIGVKRHGGDLALYGVPVTKMPNLRGFIVNIITLSPEFTMAAIVLASVIVLLIAAWGGRGALPHWQLAIAISAATLVGYHVLTHDLSVLLVPISILLSEPKAQGRWVITMVWFPTLLCFFALDYVVALPLMIFFVVLLFAARPTAGDRNPSPPPKILELFSWSNC